jgi:DNA invertase Pin-like site-specific DNA recombinase
MKFSCLPSRDYKSRIDRLLDEGLDEKVVNAYNEGKKVQQISEELGVSRDVVYRVLKENGVRAYHHDNSRDKGLAEKKDTILQLYQQGLKPKEIMIQLGMKNPKMIYETLNDKSND